MRDSRGFDEWAKDYERDVDLSDQNGGYPFGGYGLVQDAICARVLSAKNARVLDLGFGTGRLTKRLYDGGCEIWGIDFSHEMIAASSAKMPRARLIAADLREGLPEALSGLSFDFIVATYSLHHLPDEEKASLISELVGRLAPGGELLIGDVAFPNRAELESCRARTEVKWDDSEFYFVVDELLPRIEAPASFSRMSVCAGVLAITRE